MKSIQKTILYVDNDADDVVMLRNAIGVIDTEHQVIEAPDGLRALKLLKDLRMQEALPCLIILDINMPVMDGKQTLVALQKDSELSSIPIVLFSTSSSALGKTFSKAKRVELFTKPFDFKSLHVIAHKLLSYCSA